MLRLLFGVPWRQTQGLLKSILTLMDLEICTPDHTTLSRRCRGLDVAIPQRPAGESLHVILDATGLKVFGRGEWASAKHGGGPKGLIVAVSGDIERITADGGYDRVEVYEAASRVGAKVVIPPRKDTVLPCEPTLVERNQHVEHRNRVGKRQWRVDTEHHKQARVENRFHPYKRTFGRGMRARTEDGQLVEVLTGCQILNRKFELSKPESVAVRT